MRRSMFVWLLGLAVVFGLSMPAFASTLLTFTAVNGTSDGGVYTGIYQGTLSGVSGTQNFMCDDYSDHITFGESWYVTTHNIEDLIGGPFSGVTFGDNANPAYNHLDVSPQLQAYAEALHIAQGLLENPTTGDPQASIDSFAIWTLMNNGVGAPPDISAAVSTAITNAGKWWSNTCSTDESKCLSDLANVNIYVPDQGNKTTWTDGQPQEFLGLTTTTPTPEPVSMILMGSFLSLAGGLLSRKKRTF